MTYFDNGGGDGLSLAWEGPGFGTQAIDATVLRATSSGNLKQQALQAIAAWPGHQEEKISDLAELIKQNSSTGAALSALAALPGKVVAEKLSPTNAAAVLKALIARASAASPVERQSAEFTDWLQLGTNLVSVASVEGGAKQLKALRESIPVKADPKVMQLGAEVYARGKPLCHVPSTQWPRFAESLPAHRRYAVGYGQ